MFADDCLSKMRSILSTMVGNGRIDTSICDDVLQQFGSFLHADVVADKRAFVEYDRVDPEQRIDSFLRYINW